MSKGKTWTPLLEGVGYNDDLRLLGWYEGDEWIVMAGWYEAGVADRCWYGYRPGHECMDAAESIEPTHWMIYVEGAPAIAPPAL